MRRSCDDRHTKGRSADRVGERDRADRNLSVFGRESLEPWHMDSIRLEGKHGASPPYPIAEPGGELTAAGPNIGDNHSPGHQAIYEFALRVPTSLRPLPADV